MAVIHRTTMEPTKLELLTEWLPTREWYAGGEARPAKAGGFRLDDPEGEVGIEFMAVTDGEGADAPAYLVPMTYRGAPLEGAEHALIGTSEHGVLGTRWIYDGTHDPVLVGQLYALLAGRVEPQAQSLSDTPDPTVAVTLDAPVEAPAGVELVRVVDGPAHTAVVVRASATAAPVTLRVRRLLGAPAEPETGAAEVGLVTADWQRGDGSPARGTYVTLLAEPSATPR